MGEKLNLLSKGKIGTEWNGLHSPHHVASQNWIMLPSLAQYLVLVRNSSSTVKVNLGSPELDKHYLGYLHFDYTLICSNASYLCIFICLCYVWLIFSILFYF